MPKPLPSTNKRNDGYVGILFFTALLMGGGILMMYFENDDYQFEHQVKTAAPQKVSALQKLKSAAPEAPPVPAPDAAPPQSRIVPTPPPVVIAPPQVTVVAPTPAPVEGSPMPNTVKVSVPLVQPEAKPVEAGPPVIQPGFTLPRRR